MHKEKMLTEKMCFMMMKNYYIIDYNEQPIYSWTAINYY